MKLLMINQTEDRLPRAWLERWLKGLAVLLQRRGVVGAAAGARGRVGARGRTVARGRTDIALGRRELVVVFVEADEIRRLNLQYRGKDYATDVLSLSSADPSSLGELVLCWSVVREQSRETGLSERGELGYMVVHGVLHLLGYDHEVAREQKVMFALQDELFAELQKRIGLR